MKRFLKVLSAIVAVVLMLNITVFAEDGVAKIYANEVSAKAGEKVKVEIKADNNPGIALATIKVSYDEEAFKLVKVIDGGKWGISVHSPNLTSCPYTLFWSNPLIKENIVESGTIATLEFEIAKNAKSGKYPIVVSYDAEKGDIIDAELKKVDFEVGNGEITVRSNSSSGGGSSGGGGGGGSSINKKDDKETETKPVTPDETETSTGTEAPEVSVKPVHVCPSAAFNDVTEENWYHDSVDYVVGNGLMNGVSADTFAPDATLTRAMLVTVLYRAEENVTLRGKIPFTDVNSDAYYADAVLWAYEANIVNGIDDKTFAPDANITREQAATIIYRYAVHNGLAVAVLSENLGFNDADSITPYAVTALNWAVSKNIIGGYDDNTVRPGNSITRAEMATMLQRYLNK